MDNQKLYKKQNLQLLNEFHLGMFTYEGLPETLRANYLEYWLQKYGIVAVFRNKYETPGFPVGSLICGVTQLGTDLDPYGEGSEVISVTRNGYEYRHNRYSDDVVVGYNNFMERGNPDVLKDAEILANIDVSLDFLIFWTRLSPLIKVSDDKQRQTVINAFKSMQAGVPVTLVCQNLLKDLDIAGDDITTELLTQPDFADKIQYTARLREDILRWHYTRYGQCIQGDTKMAQQSVDEVNGTVSASLVIPFNMLAQRKKMVEEINTKFGTSITVDLSEAWRTEVTKYEAMAGEEDNKEEDPTEKEVEDNGENGNEDPGVDTGNTN